MGLQNARPRSHTDSLPGVAIVELDGNRVQWAVVTMDERSITSQCLHAPQCLNDSNTFTSGYPSLTESNICANLSSWILSSPPSISSSLLSHHREVTHSLNHSYPPSPCFNPQHKRRFLFRYHYLYVFHPFPVITPNFFLLDKQYFHTEVRVSY